MIESYCLLAIVSIQPQGSIFEEGLKPGTIPLLELEQVPILNEMLGQVVLLLPELCPLKHGGDS
jgi:hypothetical protein